MHGSRLDRSKRSPGAGSVASRCFPVRIDEPERNKQHLARMKRSAHEADMRMDEAGFYQPFSWSLS